MLEVRVEGRFDKNIRIMMIGESWVDKLVGVAIQFVLAGEREMRTLEGLFLKILKLFS